jgi:hypothetical protein
MQDTAKFSNMFSPTFSLPGTVILHEPRSALALTSCHRSFTIGDHIADKEESAIADEIFTDEIIPARHFIGVDFQELALRKCRDPMAFQCSNQFIHDFKVRHGFSSRRFHARRPHRQTGRADFAEWVERMKELPAGVRPQRVVKCDETAW